MERLLPFARTAALVAFEGGAFNPISIWEMEAEFDRIWHEAQRQGVEYEVT